MHTVIEQNQTPQTGTPKAVNAAKFFTDGRRSGSPCLPAFSISLPSAQNPMYRHSSVTSQFRFTGFTFCYWRNPAASGALACISENT